MGSSARAYGLPPRRHLSITSTASQTIEIVDQHLRQLGHQHRTKEQLAIIRDQRHAESLNKQRIGKLYDSPNTAPLADRVRQKVTLFMEQHLGRRPTLCQVHPSIIPAGMTEIDGIEIRPMTMFSVMTIWLGIEPGKEVIPPATLIDVPLLPVPLMTPEAEAERERTINASMTFNVQRLPNLIDGVTKLSRLTRISARIAELKRKLAISGPVIHLDGLVEMPTPVILSSKIINPEYIEAFKAAHSANTTAIKILIDKGSPDQWIPRPVDLEAPRTVITLTAEEIAAGDKLEALREETFLKKRGHGQGMTKEADLTEAIRYAVEHPNEWKAQSLPHNFNLKRHKAESVWIVELHYLLRGVSIEVGMSLDGKLYAFTSSEEQIAAYWKDSEQARPKQPDIQTPPPWATQEREIAA